jgi:PTS system nitrogen regulatory IIA component
MLLASYLDARNILFERRVLTKEQIYQLLVENICHYNPLPICGSKLLEMILKRDEEAPTAYPTGIAIPHIRMDGFEDTVVAMAFLQNPLDYEGRKISWIVLIITDKSSSKLYLNMVAALLRLSKDDTAMAALASAQDGHGVIHNLKRMQTEVKKDLAVADIMIGNSVSINPEAKLSELSRLMAENHVAGMPVVDKDMRYVGEVDVLNLLKVGIPDFMMMMDHVGFLSSYEPLEQLFDQENTKTVGEIMVTGDKILAPSDSVIEAVLQMLQHKKRFFSVVENGKLVGILTAMDVFKKVIQA